MTRTAATAHGPGNWGGGRLYKLPLLPTSPAADDAPTRGLSAEARGGAARGDAPTPRGGRLEFEAICQKEAKRPPRDVRSFGPHSHRQSKENEGPSGVPQKFGS